MERVQLKPDWMNRLLDTCEEVGVSKQMLEHFLHFYVLERRTQDANLAAITKGTKRTKN